MAGKSGIARPNCRWVAVMLVDDSIEVSFTVSDKQMTNWMEIPRTTKTIRNYCYMVRSALARQHSIQVDRVVESQIKLIDFQPRFREGQAAQEVPLEDIVAETTKPRKPTKAPAGQGSLF